MPDIPTVEPSTFFAGDTVRWTKDLSDYPASTHTLKYNLVSSDASAKNIAIVSTADGDTHSITVAKAVSGAYTAGDYKWFSYIVDIGDTVRYQIASGTVVIQADPSVDTDTRSNAKKALDELWTAYHVLDSGTSESYSIAGREYTRKDLASIRAEIDAMEARYGAEIQKESVANGTGTGRTVKVRFTNA